MGAAEGREARAPSHAIEAMRSLPAARLLRRWGVVKLCAAGIPSARPFHTLRHDNATLSLLAVVNAKTTADRLGHHSPAFTLERYTHAVRALDDDAADRADRVRRQVVEHRLARRVQLGIRQARYVGRTKTLFQLLLAAAVANLTLLANSAAPTGDRMVVAGAAFTLAMILLARRSRPDDPEGSTPDLRWLVPRSASPTLQPAATGLTTLRTGPSRPGF
jgi:hypothetical protein